MALLPSFGLLRCPEQTGTYFLTAPKWVEEEVDAALDREHHSPGTFLLFPIRLDEEVMQTRKAWARAVRQRYIGDFRQWNDETRYTNALQRLLRDLKK